MIKLQIHCKLSRVKNERYTKKTNAIVKKNSMRPIDEKREVSRGWIQFVRIFSVLIDIFFVRLIPFFYVLADIPEDIPIQSKENGLIIGKDYIYFT